MAVKSTNWSPTGVSSTNWLPTTTNSTNWGEGSIFSDFYLLLQGTTTFGLLLQDGNFLLGLQQE